jgi:hypothetical protein
LKPAVVGLSGVTYDHDHGQGHQVQVYPYAVSLMETMQTYGQTLGLVEHNQGIEGLATEYWNKAQRIVAKGVVWFLLASVLLLTRPACLYTCISF